MVMRGGINLGPSWLEIEHAARVLKAAGHENVAFALEGLLSGSDPREEFSRAGLARERMAHRDRMIGELYLAAFNSLTTAQAGTVIATGWAKYEAREAAIDRRAGKLPRSVLSSGGVSAIERSYFERLSALGMKALCARQITNILTSPAFALVAAEADEVALPKSFQARLETLRKVCRARGLRADARPFS
jgi:hypothetical protein